MPTYTFDNETIGQSVVTGGGVKEVSGAPTYQAGKDGVGIKILLGDQVKFDAPGADGSDFSASGYFRVNQAVTSSAIRVTVCQTATNVWVSLVRAHSNGLLQVTNGSTLDQEGPAYVVGDWYRWDAQITGAGVVTWRFYDDNETVIWTTNPINPGMTPSDMSLGAGGGPSNADTTHDTLRQESGLAWFDPYAGPSGPVRYIGTQQVVRTYVGAAVVSGGTP